MKKILLFVVFLLSAVSLFAGPIGEQRARQIAENFFASHSTRSISGAITLEWAGDSIGAKSAEGSALNTSLMYIYNRGNKDGFVVVAGDSNVTPIIAYSLDTTLDTSNMAEATETILDAWCRQVESARQAAKPISGTAMRAAMRSNDAVRYETALWNQNAPFCYEAPVIDGYYSATGCVATAMSIICYYHRWPERGVGTTPAYEYTDAYGYTRNVAANTLGRTYNYDNMLMNYNNGYTEAQGKAVAALMKDMGTSVYMQYHPEGSGAYPTDVIKAFSTYFGYSKSIQLVFGVNYSAEEWSDIVRENIRNYGPTYFSASSDNGGHAFVADGFDSGDYFHFNFGWGGYGNGYFLLPSIEYYMNQKIILGLEPDKDGTSVYRDNLCLYASGSYNGIAPYEVTGYTTGSSFYCLVGGLYNIGVQTFNGEIKLVLCDRDGNWKEELSTLELSIDPGYIGYADNYDYVTITEQLNEGDCLQLYYKAYNCNEWQRARCYDESAVDEVLVMGSPEDMAEGFYFAYNKSAQKIYLGNTHAMHIYIYNDETNDAIGWADLELNTVGTLTNLPSGTYRIEASLGSEPYVFKVKL